MPAIRVAIDLQVNGELNGNEVEEGIEKFWHHQKTGVNGMNIVTIDIVAVKGFFQNAGIKFFRDLMPRQNSYSKTFYHSLLYNL